MWLCGGFRHSGDDFHWLQWSHLSLSGCRLVATYGGTWVFISRQFSCGSFKIQTSGSCFVGLGTEHRVCLTILNLLKDLLRKWDRFRRQDKKRINLIQEKATCHMAACSVSCWPWSGAHEILIFWKSFSQQLVQRAVDSRCDLISLFQGSPLYTILMSLGSDGKVCTEFKTDGVDLSHCICECNMYFFAQSCWIEELKLDAGLLRLSLFGCKSKRFGAMKSVVFPVPPFG